MATGSLSARKKLNAFRTEYNFSQMIPCSNEENARYQDILKNGGMLPSGVFPFEHEGVSSNYLFYTIHDGELTNEEKLEYLAYTKAGYLRTIRNCVVFFTVLAVISLVAGIVISLGAL